MVLTLSLVANPNIPESDDCRLAIWRVPEDNLVILFWLSPEEESGNPSLNHLIFGIGTPSAKHGSTATERSARVWFDGPKTKEMNI